VGSEVGVEWSRGFGGRALRAAGEDPLCVAQFRCARYAGLDAESHDRYELMAPTHRAPAPARPDFARGRTLRAAPVIHPFYVDGDAGESCHSTLERISRESRGTTGSLVASCHLAVC
jgi:hypothetical protein